MVLLLAKYSKSGCLFRPNFLKQVVIEIQKRNNSSKILKVTPRAGYTSNILLAIAIQLQQIIARPLHAQISVCSMSCAGNGTSSEELQKY